MPTTSTHPQVLVNTSYGPFTIELHPEQAPTTVGNFLTYVDEGFYAGTIFHRVVEDFVIQGGGFTTGLEARSTHDPIVLESDNGLSNLRGTVAMARTSTPDSATSQFYVNTVDNTGLDYQSADSPGYAVFGSVTDGMTVVDAIANAHTFNLQLNATTLFQNVPFPFLIEILGVQRHTPAATLVATPYTAGATAHGVGEATFSAGRAWYGVELNSDQTLEVTLLDGSHAGVTLANLPRLHFSDTNLAYDIDGAAGQTARIINATFGYSYLMPELAGIGLELFDQGYSLEEVATMALSTPLWSEVAGGTDNASFVTRVYANVMGGGPDTGTQSYYQGMLDRGEATQAGLLALAAASDANDRFIDVVGLSHAGLAYV